MERLCNDFHPPVINTSDVISVATTPYAGPEINSSELVAVSSDGIGHAWVGWIVPAICSLGIIGNVFNLALLTRRLHEGVDSLEKGALYCMTSLAGTDLCFCLLSFLEKFVSRKSLIYVEKNASYFYLVYGNPIQDMLIKLSTWLTVIMAISRYIAVCRPLMARHYASPCRVLTAIVIGTIGCVVLHIPVLWTWHVEYVPCPGNKNVYVLIDGSFSSNATLRVSFMYIWAILGFFLPVAVLSFCNAHLILSLRESARIQRHSQVKRTSQSNDAQKRISITLIAIVILFFLLICPSECLHFYGEAIGASNLSNYDLGMRITNILQVCNFSVNFLLYCIVNSYFREALRAFFLRLCCCRSSPNQSSKRNNMSTMQTKFSVLSHTDREPC